MGPFFFAGLLFAGTWTTGCEQDRERAGPPAEELAQMPWDSVVALARNTEVTWRMWRGDPAINDFVDGWVTRALADRYGVRLAAVEGRGAELVLRGEVQPYLEEFGGIG